MRVSLLVARDPARVLMVACDTSNKGTPPRRTHTHTLVDPKGSVGSAISFTMKSLSILSRYAHCDGDEEEEDGDDKDDVGDHGE